MALIALGISSSVSIYKSCEIIRRFQDKKAEVQVIMTKNASRLMSPLLFSALSRRDVIVDPYEDKQSAKIAHVALAKETSLLLVAPATANIIGKFAAGVADDFLSTFYTAVQCPVLVAPAMNEAMYLHRQTQQNIRKLEGLGVKFVDPESGYLACEDAGWGRLASPEKIVEEGLNLIQKSQRLKGKTVLVTAGPTREFLDPVRFVTNRSSGKMGYALAEEALRRGAEVILVSGPTHLFPPPNALFREVQTAEDMKAEVMGHFPKADIVIMAAAVSDFKFEKASSNKVKKEKLGASIKIAPVPDVLRELGRKKGQKVLVGFAAETEKVVDNALQKLKEKNLDLIIANDVMAEGIGFESDFNRVSLVFRGGRSVQTEKMTKIQISQIIMDKIEEIVGKKS